MNVLGIIAEYNPFHKGHSYHLKESVKKTNAGFTVCVMSGNFMQRGEPAMVNKWTRARMAVENGVDLVLELPFTYACNNAEYFAKGGIDILNRLGCITHLSFGSESGDLELLSHTASLLANESRELKESIKEFTDRGFSFPKARYEAVRKCAGEEAASVLNSANNILAVEYLKQLHRTGSRIEPITVIRYGTGYHDIDPFQNIASASAIRRKINEANHFECIRDFMPKETLQILKEIDKGVNVIFNDFFQMLVYQVLTSSAEYLGTVLSATEGLENKVKKAVSDAKNMETLIKAVKSKRYTETRIQRLLSHILIGLDKDSFQLILKERINYCRVLAFNKKGAELLKQIKLTGCNSIPVLTNINRELTAGAKEWNLLKYDILASDIYNLVADGEIYKNSDYVVQPFKDFE